MFFLLLLLYAVSDVTMDACGRAEYYTGQECCPMCSPGHYVKRTCTETTSTTCVPCQNSTFIDKPNGMPKCFSCSVCETSVGLRLKRPCTSISGTLCEPLEGHYCTDPNKNGCREAVEHTKCKPGQYINQTGTAFTDTACVDCDNNTYSDGSFTFCRPHTRCESQGLFTRQPGTHTADAECEHRRHHLLLTPLALAFIITISTLVLSAGCRKSKTPNGCMVP